MDGLTSTGPTTGCCVGGGGVVGSIGLIGGTVGLSTPPVGGGGGVVGLGAGVGACPVVAGGGGGVGACPVGPGGVTGRPLRVGVTGACPVGVAPAVGVGAGGVVGLGAGGVSPGMGVFVWGSTSQVNPLALSSWACSARDNPARLELLSRGDPLPPVTLRT